MRCEQLSTSSWWSVGKCLKGSGFLNALHSSVITNCSLLETPPWVQLGVAFAFSAVAAR